MKTLLQLEEAAMFGICIFFLVSLHIPWWAYLLVLAGPDISAAGYFFGNRIGAECYNFFHHKGIAIVIFGIGVLLNSPLGDMVSLAGIMLFGHASMDRMLGMGLKLNDGFKYTHLGIIGNRNN
ncbi:MAG: DUF4260 domain-containing protein [Bacteroidetes bacterium]|nr:DUF4260 domain-containing protein [Bacteroidota bacterium]MBS1931821.1 DUF4260 domain-containing protein [Bacteroidota bacterium]